MNSIRSIRKGILSATLVVSVALGGLVTTGASAHASSSSGPPLTSHGHNVGPDQSGREVLASHPERVGEIARRTRLSVPETEQLLRDPSVRVLDSGGVYFEDTAMPAATAAAAAGTSQAGPFAYSSTFLLHSKPDSNRTIYLDFDGETISGTVWPADDATGSFTALPFSLDSLASFSNPEMDSIQAIWQRVAEDYAPFDVDVTTQDPGFAKIDRSSAADAVYGTRMVVTNSPAAQLTAKSQTGVAQINAFDQIGAAHAQTQPAFAFPAGLSFDSKNVADVITHEIGHNLGLNHAGLIQSPSCASLRNTCEYYEGHGVWAPIMGATFSKPVGQWSKGEYANAFNLQDDIAVMASHGAVARADDHSNDTGTATRLSTAAAGVITPGAALDYDLFKYTASTTGSVTFSAAPAVAGPNLDISLALYSGTPALLAQNNPPAAFVSTAVASGLDASITYPVVAGTTYYLQVGPSANLTPATGYSTYGSIGQYTVSASVPGSVPVAAPSVSSISPASGPVGSVISITGGNLIGATSVKFNGVASAFTVVSSTQVNATVPASATTGAVSVTTPGGTATSSASFTVTVATPTTKPTVSNGGFESGLVASNPWVASAGVIRQAQADNPVHGGSWDGWLGGQGVVHTDTLYQDVAVPAGVASAKVSFYLDVTTAEGTSAAFDKLSVQVRNTSDVVQGTLASFSNLDSPGGYGLKTFDVSAYAGKTIRLYFSGTEDSSLQTSFLVDDVSLSTELARNGGFESGLVASNPWVASAGVIRQAQADNPVHGGSWDGWLGGQGVVHTDTLYQDVAVPAGVASAKVSFYLDVTTAEGTSAAFDKLSVQVRNTSDVVQGTLASFSNLDSPGGYGLKTFDVSAYAGKTIRLYFSGTEDSSLQTSFLVDDVTVTTS